MLEQFSPYAREDGLVEKLTIYEDADMEIEFEVRRATLPIHTSADIPIHTSMHNSMHTYIHTSLYTREDGFISRSAPSTTCRDGI